jgi:hypothetical protein
VDFLFAIKEITPTKNKNIILESVQECSNESIVKNANLSIHTKEHRFFLLQFYVTGVHILYQRYILCD